MNSPPDPGSPTYSMSSSDSPPPEQVPASSEPLETKSPSTVAGIFQLANQVAASLTGGGGASKRRNPPSHGSGTRDAPPSTRDSKLRRRGDSGRGNWESRGESQSSKKDDYVDSAIIDYIRKEIGDPLLEISTS